MMTLKDRLARDGKDINWLHKETGIPATTLYKYWHQEITPRRKNSDKIKEALPGMTLDDMLALPRQRKKTIKDGIVAMRRLQQEVSA